MITYCGFFIGHRKTNWPNILKSICKMYNLECRVIREPLKPSFFGRMFGIRKERILFTIIGCPNDIANIELYFTDAELKVTRTSFILK